ncbi:putative phage abortive infection protein [Pseudoalteromonas sp. S1608]|uniref:putative phage abortive infection protein n=1 Tax=Pseudoalteromonas sp. S1608 TaxID=579504 RepID=UPI00110A6C58|nr:putative phage abortive infection protein [Pseudoalteromonas sp. S1608]TMP73505.1 hypothetical protein CWB75_14100 [Pseudoalteromonas sp. S1608]
MENFIKIICIIAVTSAVIAITVFISHFGFGFASNIGNWGAIGDFFGGVLNPMFALFSLILIAHTLMQNKQALEQSEKAIEQGTKAIEQNEKALQVSNKELELTRNELKNSATALEEQAKLLAVQSFETTFFNMLELHSKTLKQVKFNPDRTFMNIIDEVEVDQIRSRGESSGSDAFFSIMFFISEISQGKNALKYFDIFYLWENKCIKSYYITLYQILKMIENTPFSKLDKKKYSNVLRAQLSNQELVILMLFCINPRVNNAKFKGMVIEFNLLEHLDIVYTPDYKNFILDAAKINVSQDEINEYLEFDEQCKLTNSAFGENSVMYSYCYEKGFLKKG